MNPIDVISGNSPIVLGQPHSGTFVPKAILASLNPLGQKLLDTDWHVPQLYDGLMEDVTVVKANFSRYVIDANRDPNGGSLYPGQNTTELVPSKTFDGVNIWSVPPTTDEIESRRVQFHSVYHAALEAELQRVKSLHGFAVLYDCHSIRSEIPYLFDATLPDLNIGNNSGKTCAQDITDAVEAVCFASNDFSYVVNGRFKGGWTTRHYGKPQNNVHAIQMELAQRRYLKTEIPPFEYDAHRAEKLRQLLRNILSNIETTLKSQKYMEI